MTSEATLLLVSSVARLFGVTPASVRAWERSGKLKAMRTENGVRLFSRADVEALALKRGVALPAVSSDRIHVFGGDTR